MPDEQSATSRFHVVRVGRDGDRRRPAARRGGGDRQFRRRASRPPRGDRRRLDARPRARTQGGGADLFAASAAVLPAAGHACSSFRRARQAAAAGGDRARRRHRHDASTPRWPRPRPRISSSSILVGRFGIGGAAIGFDFHFGKNRVGSPDYLAPSRARGSALPSISCRRWKTRAGRCPPARCARRSPQAEVVEAAELSGRAMVRLRRGYPWRQARARAWFSDRQSEADPVLRSQARHLCCARRRRGKAP